jgi:trimeric autotransporter adhesin
MLPEVTKKERKITQIGVLRMETERSVASKALAFGLVATLMTLIMLLAAKPTHASILTVTNTNDSGAGSLRQAILDANDEVANPGLDTITFNIPDTDTNCNATTDVCTISPTSTLPTISNPLTIDGTTQPGYVNSPVIELNGSGAGNGESGLTITAGSSTVKGMSIYNFAQHGIHLQTGNGNTIVGNYIGTDASGTASGKGNSNNGVFVDQPDNNLIGGSHPGEGNVISGNGNSGVRLGFTEDTTLQGNLIGTDKNGASLGNFSNGVHLDNALDCQIGGMSPEAANVIAFNGPPAGSDGAGIVVGSGGGHDILRNSIFSSNGLGIDLSNSFPLDGVSPNDPAIDKDSDFGPNGLQNFPVLTSARDSDGKTTIKGKLNSDDLQTFTIQFFSSPEKDPSGNGEGKKFLGQKPVTTNADGNASFTFKKKVPKGQFVTATATSLLDGTSEFSNARKVVRRQ